MIEIRNLLIQPLTFQLAGEQRGLHLGARQRRLIEDAHVSEDIRSAAKGGFIALTPQTEPDQPEAQPVVEPEIDESVQVTDETAVASEDSSSGTDTEAVSEQTTRKRSKT